MGEMPNHNSIPASAALAVTNPKSLGPPAEGPIYVAPPGAKYLAQRVTAFDDSGAQISLIWEDRIPYGARNTFQEAMTSSRARTLRLPPKPRQFQGPNSPNNRPDLSPVPGTASVPVPRPQPDLPSGESRPSTPLPMPLGHTEQCQSPSFQTDETTTTSLLAPVLTSVLECCPGPPPRDLTPNPLSSPSLVPLPVSVARETGSLDPSSASPRGMDSQPVPELVTTACESTTPPPSVSSLSPPNADPFMSHYSALPRWADELCGLRQLMSELVNKIPVAVSTPAKMRSNVPETQQSRDAAIQTDWSITRGPVPPVPVVQIPPKASAPAPKRRKMEPPKPASTDFSDDSDFE
ncbi:uncharacterized protein [Macrobrachium rosenbergii]|uniref:uncharacterized protein n=1 Tax=Macrobrachium rosenbergii TaxID=79674 RepID=UPI0034D47C5E